MTKKIIAILFLGIFFSSCTQTNEPAEKYSVFGIVIDEDGETISGVKVWINENVDYTDALGKFSISDVTPGNYIINCEKNMFNTFEQNLTVGGENKEFNISLIAETNVLINSLQDGDILMKRHSPYRISSNITSINGTIRIEPGVMLKFYENTEIEGNIIAEGTLENKIIFTSYASQWGKITFKPSSIIRFCEIQNASGDEFECAVGISAGAIFENCKLVNSARISPEFGSTIKFITTNSSTTDETLYISNSAMREGIINIYNSTIEGITTYNNQAGYGVTINVISSNILGNIYASEGLPDRGKISINLDNCFLQGNISGANNLVTITSPSNNLITNAGCGW